MGSTTTPASRSPARIASTTSDEFWPTSRMRTSGWPRWNVAHEVRAEVVARAAEDAERRACRRAARARRRRRRAPPRPRPAPRSACGRSVRPASVATRPRPTRWKRATPSSSSSRRTCSETDGWREVQRLGGRAEGPVLDRRQEVLQLLERHRRFLEMPKTIKASAEGTNVRSCGHDHSLPQSSVPRRSRRSRPGTAPTPARSSTSAPSRSRTAQPVARAPSRCATTAASGRGSRSA